MAVARTRPRQGGVAEHRGRILSRLRARVDDIAATTAQAIVDEVVEFGPIRDNLLYQELLVFATEGIRVHLTAMQRRTPPTREETEFIRERSIRRARELVPMAAMLRSFLIANRSVCRAISEEAGSSVESLRAGLDLMSLAFEHTTVTTTVMAVAYVETVQGDLADLDRQRRELMDTVLVTGFNSSAGFVRRAAGMGLPTERRSVVVVATATEIGSMQSSAEALRWGVQAIARCGERPASNAFVVSRGDEILAFLRSAPGHSALAVLREAASIVERSHGVLLRAGIGPEFVGLSALRTSYEHARRALRHTTRDRPFLLGPDEVLLFDELISSAADSVAEIVSPQIRLALEDPTIRVTIESFVKADLNVVNAAKALHVHPNTLRYRLKRIEERTGRDPRKVPDLLELIAASRVSQRGDPGTAPR
jgi:sugar diacid utilization regulator